MADHIRVDYASLRAEIDDITARAADSGRPVVLQEPPSLVEFIEPDAPLERFERHMQKKISGEFARTAQGFETLLEHLEVEDFPAWVFESTEPLEEADAAEEVASEWGGPITWPCSYPPFYPFCHTHFNRSSGWHTVSPGGVSS